MADLLKNLGYYNGKYDLIENMTVPMSDRVCWFGDGVYDATATRNGVIYCLDDHIDRFYNSAAAIQIEIPYEKEELNAREGIAFHNHSKELCNNTRNRMGGYGCFIVGTRRPGRRKRKIGRSDCQNKVEQG